MEKWTVYQKPYVVYIIVHNSAYQFAKNNFDLIDSHQKIDLNRFNNLSVRSTLLFSERTHAAAVRHAIQPCMSNITLVYSLYWLCACRWPAADL